MKIKKSDREGTSEGSAFGIIMGIVLMIVGLGILLKPTETKTIEEIDLSNFKGKISSYDSYQECLNKQFLPTISRDDQFYELLKSEGSCLFYDPDGTNPIVVSKIDTLKLNGSPINLRQLLSQKTFGVGFDYTLSYKYDQNKITIYTYKDFKSLFGMMIGTLAFIVFLLGLVLFIYMLTRTRE